MYDDYNAVSKLKLFNTWLKETGWFPVFYLACFTGITVLVSQSIVGYILTVSGIGEWK